MICKHSSVRHGVEMMRDAVMLITRCTTRPRCHRLRVAASASADVTTRCGQFALPELSDDDSHLADGLGDIRLRGTAASYLSAVSA